MQRWFVVEFGWHFALESRRFRIEAALLRLACELRYHTVQPPNLDIVAVNKLPGGLNGCRVIRTIQIDRFHEMAVAANNVSSVVGHITLAKSGQSARTLSHRQIPGAGR
jgi:hypothetical protein